MKKTISFMLSIIAIASIASITVLGNTQNAYAGFACTIDPNMVDAGILPFGERFVVVKTITCGENIVEVIIDNSDCAAKRIDVRLGDFGINNNVWNGEEVIDNNNSFPGKTTCTVIFVASSTGPDDEFLTQTIMVTTPEPPIVGGEFLPIDTTALLLVSAQSFSWMIPVVLSVLGIGLFIFRKSENS